MRLPHKPESKDESGVREADPNFTTMMRLESRANAAHLTVQYLDRAPVGYEHDYHYQLVPTPYARRAWGDPTIEAIEIRSTVKHGLVFLPKTVRMDTAELHTRCAEYRSMLQLTLAHHVAKRLQQRDMLAVVYWLLTNLQPLLDTNVALRERKAPALRTRVLVEALRLGYVPRPRTSELKKGSGRAFTLRFSATETSTLRLIVRYTKSKTFSLCVRGQEASLRRLWGECEPEDKDERVRTLLNQHPYVDAYVQALTEMQTDPVWQDRKGANIEETLFAMGTSRDTLRDLATQEVDAVQDANQEVLRGRSVDPTPQTAWEASLQVIVRARIASYRNIEALDEPLREVPVQHLRNLLDTLAGHPALPVFLAYAGADEGGEALYIEYSRDGSPLLGRGAAASIVWQPSRDVTRTTPALITRASTVHHEDEKTLTVHGVSKADRQHLRNLLDHCTTPRSLLLALPSLLDVLRKYDVPHVRTVKEWQRAEFAKQLVAVTDLSRDVRVN